MIRQIETRKNGRGDVQRRTEETFRVVIAIKSLEDSIPNVLARLDGWIMTEMMLVVLGEVKVPLFWCEVVDQIETVF